MARSDLGHELVNVGWRQGVLLQTLPSSTHFLIDDPLTAAAKQATRSLDRGRAENCVQKGAATQGHTMAFGNAKGGKERLVIISQTCDIIKKPSVEPDVAAIRAFFTDDTHTLTLAGGNSTRLFLLDNVRGLVAEFSNLAIIEKPLLAKLTPEVGTPDELTQRRFAEWLGWRFKRPAYEESVVGAVVGPLLEKLKLLKEAADPVLAILEQVREIRLARLKGAPPYDVHLLFMVDAPGLASAQDEALTRLIGRLVEAFDPTTARLAGAVAKHPFEIALGDFLNTEKLDLDFYTYRGRTYRGLGPLSLA